MKEKLKPNPFAMKSGDVISRVHLPRNPPKAAAMTQVTDKEKINLIMLQDLDILGVEFRPDKERRVERSSVPTSDTLHEFIRSKGYEIGQVVEREPQGIIRLQLVKYKKDEDRSSGTSPIIDIKECLGNTLREAFLEGVVKIIKEGI